jgi:hypothetical protein
MSLSGRRVAKSDPKVLKRYGIDPERLLTRCAREERITAKRR